MNPILCKDVLQTLREKRVAVVQSLLIIVLGVGVLACWPQGGVLAVATLSHDTLFDTLMLGQMAFLLLFVPGAAAVSLVSEIEGQTFEMLHASRLSGSQILLGKIAGAIAFPILLLLTCLPFVGLLMLRGASSIQSLLIVYLALLTTAIYLSMTALAVSSLFRTTTSALVAVYVVVVAVCLAPLVPAAILLDSSAGWVAAGLHYSRGLSPVAAILAILRPDWGDFDGHVHSFISLLPVFLVSAGVMIVVWAILLAIRLTDIRCEADYGETIELPDRSLWTRLLFQRASTAVRPPIATRNPLLINEGRINAAQSGVWCVRLFYFSVVTSMGLALISLYGGAGDPGLLNRATRTVIAFQVGVIALITPVLTSAVISSERERGTFELLRMTSLRPGEIFLGKLIPALIPSLLPIIAFLPAYATICFLDRGYIPYFLKLVPVLALATVFCSMAGLVCSAFLHQTARATVAGYVVVSSVVFAPILLAWVAGRGLSDEAVAWIAMPSPMYVALDVINIEPTRPTGAPIFSAHLVLGILIILGLLLITRLRIAAMLREG